eukprot:g6157.t1
MLPKCVTESAAVERNTRYAHVERSHETQSSSTEGNCLYSSCHYEDGLELWMRNEISGSTVVIDAEGRSGGGRARGGAASKSRSRSRGAAGGAPRNAATSISHGAGAEVEDYSFLLEWEQLTAAEIAEIKDRQRTKFVKCSVIAVSDELVIYKNVAVDVDASHRSDHDNSLDRSDEDLVMLHQAEGGVTPKCSEKNCSKGKQNANSSEDGVAAVAGSGPGKAVVPSAASRMKIQHQEQDSSLCNCLTGSRNEESRQLDVEDASQEGGVGFDLVHCDSGDDIDIIIDEVDEHEPSRCPTDGDAPPASVACDEEHGVDLVEKKEESSQVIPEEAAAIPEQVDEEDDVDMNGEMYCTTPTTRGGSCATFHRNYPGCKNDLPDPDAPGFGPKVKGLNKENVNSYANYKPKRRLQLGPRQSQIGINVDAVEKSTLAYPPGASRVAHQHHFGGHQNQIVAGQEPGLRKQLQPFPRQRDFSQQSGPQAHQDRLSRLSSFLSSSGDHDDFQRPDGSRSSAFSPLDSVDYSPTPRGTRREPELLLPPQDVGSTPPKQAQPTTTGAVDEEAKNGTEKLSGCEGEVRWGDHASAADHVVGQLRGEEAVSVAGPRSEGGSGCTTEADRLLRTMGNRDGFVPVRGRVKSLREQQQDLRREGSRRGLRGEDSEIGASRDWTSGHPLHGGAVDGLQDEFDDLLKKTDADRGQSASDIRASLSDFLSNPEVVMEATVKVAMASTKSK